MERLIELFINTEDGEFYDRGGLLAAYDPAINAGELVRLTVQLCAGVPAFNSAGVLLNPDTTFAGTLAAAETIIDNNFNWYDKGTLLENLTTGTAISELSVASEASPRQLGAVRLNAGTVVNFCGWTATEGGYRLTLADNEFKPAQFTPAADFAQGTALEVLEQPIIVSAQNDDSGRATGLFTGLLDAANPVYESMIEGHEDIPNCRIEFSIYQDGRAVFRARRYFDCLGAMAMNKGAAYVHSDSWREADSRYIKLVDWQAPPEYQFSEDGTNWHDQQQDADLYYHERRPGGQWGPAVKMKTGPTGAAAGFGNPTIAVETLPAGSAATASVAASGDNTAKVFSFNFGIPKGADGQNGADGVSSYTYVAYASDASGTGFSLTPTNALKYRAEIHTTTAIETPDADDFAGATWVKYIGDDGAGAGDMTKSVYDTNNDGIVDHAATADTVGATTAEQVADAVGKAHAHSNKATLDKLAEADGKLTYDGAEIGGVSSWDDITGKPATFPPSAHTHAQADVTGLPDVAAKAHTHSNKATLDKFGETDGKPTYDGAEIGGGSDVDESRLLPDPTTVPAGLAGHPVVFDVQEQGGTGDANTLLLMHFDDDTVDYSPNAHSATKTGDVAFQTGKFGKCLKFASASGGSYLQIPSSTAFNLANRSAWTFDVWVYLTQTPGYNAILVQRQASSPVSYQFCFSSGTRKPQLYNGSTYIATGSVELNTWTHVAFTYLNRTLKIWIGGQLDSTFTNVSLTDYDLPIEIGYHYSSTTEQFVGLLDELRLSSCDRTADQTDPMYSADGTSFTPPAKPYGVTANRFKVSESGVVTAPADPADGDIPCFDATATVGGGNDSTTKLLLQPATSNNQIVDQAAGNAAPVTLQNTGVTVDDAGAMVFDGNSYLTLAASTLPAGFLDGTDDWTLDLIYNVSSKSTQCLFGRGTSPRMDFLLQSSGALEIGGGPSLGGNWPFNTDVRLTFELYKDGSSWKYTAFRDGSVVTSGTWSSANWRSVALWIGWDGDTDSRKISGKIKALRLTAGASHKGVAFTPDELPWTQAQTVGKWGKFNKSTLVQSVNGQTPDSSGAVTIPAATASAAGLMAAADKAAIAGLTTHGIYPNASAKSGAVDFNEVIDHGMYFIGGDTAHLNYPETYQQNGGTLQVIRNGNYLTQSFIPIGINKAFFRACLNALSDSSERTFSSWQRLLTHIDIIEFISRPGYFKLPSGLFVQWGVASNITADGTTPVVFQIAFPHAMLTGYATAVSGVASASGVVISVSGISTTGMNLITKNHPGGDKDINIHWLAIGY